MMFHPLQRATEDWLLGLAARLVFAGVLAFGFWARGEGALGGGLAGLGDISADTYYRVLPAFGVTTADPGQVALWPWGLLVKAMVYGSLALPVLIVIGLFTRLAALLMMGLVALDTWVLIEGRGLDSATIGHWFDADTGSLVADQRALWGFLLLYLVIRGAGALSLDRLFMGPVRDGFEDEDDYPD